MSWNPLVRRSNPQVYGWACAYCGAQFTGLPSAEAAERVAELHRGQHVTRALLGERESEPVLPVDPAAKDRAGRYLADMPVLTYEEAKARAEDMLARAAALPSGAAFGFTALGESARKATGSARDLYEALAVPAGDEPMEGDRFANLEFE